MGNPRDQMTRYMEFVIIFSSESGTIFFRISLFIPNGICSNKVQSSTYTNRKSLIFRILCVYITNFKFPEFLLLIQIFMLVLNKKTYVMYFSKVILMSTHMFLWRNRKIYPKINLSDIKNMYMSIASPL